jgi:hypothetical protein
MKLFAEDWSGRVFNLPKVVSLDCVESLVVYENSSLAPWQGPEVGFLALPFDFPFRENQRLPPEESFLPGVRLEELVGPCQI